MKRANEIKKMLYRTFQEPAEGIDSAAMDKRILSDASTSMKQAMTANQRICPVSKWRKIMTSKITKLSSAALIIIAVTVGIIHFGGSIDGSNIVFADVLKSIQEANTAVWHEHRVMTCNGEELPFLTTDVVRYYSLKYGAKEEMYALNDILLHEVYWSVEKDARIEVAPLWKQYKRTEFTEAERTVGGRSIEAIVELVKSEKTTKLGRKTINGRKAEGFEIGDSKIAGALVPIKFDSMVARFWVDIETSLPLRYEAELVISDRHVTLFTGGKAVEVKVTGDEFQWDVELGPDMFDPNIPSDYTPMEF
jgi:hypothetical protein